MTKTKGVRKSGRYTAKMLLYCVLPKRSFIEKLHEILGKMIVKRWSKCLDRVSVCLCVFFLGHYSHWSIINTIKETHRMKNSFSRKEANWMIVCELDINSILNLTYTYTTTNNKRKNKQLSHMKKQNTDFKHPNWIECTRNYWIDDKMLTHTRKR